MAAPFEVGDPAVRFVLSQDRVTVHSTTIQGIEPCRNGWRVYDSIGRPHEVDDEGIGDELVPMDLELHNELKRYGEGFEVIEEGRLRGLGLVQEIPSQSLDGDSRER